MSRKEVNIMGLVPKQTKTEVKISGGLTLYRTFGLIVTTMLAAMVGSTIVYSKLLLPFIIFCIAVYLILTSKSPSNPNKKFYKGLIEFLTFKKNVKKFYGTNTKEYKKSIEHAQSKKKSKRK